MPVLLTISLPRYKGRLYASDMAVSSQDVAFVGAVAAAIAAIAGPLTAWLIASSNRSYEERLRYDKATEDAYRSLLRMVNARGARLTAAHAAIRSGDKESGKIAEDILGRDPYDHQELRLTFEIYASTPVAEAYRGYLQAWGDIHKKIQDMTFTEDQRGNNVVSLFRAALRNNAQVTALRDAIANDLSHRYAGSTRQRRASIRRMHRETEHHDRLARVTPMAKFVRRVKLRLPGSQISREGQRSAGSTKV